MTLTRSVWHGAKVKEAAREAAARGLVRATEELLTRANVEVPIEEATLLRSGVASVDESELRGAVSYDTPYAAKQHEELDYQHDAGRKAKYLEDPLNGMKSDGTFKRIMKEETGLR